MLKRLGLIGVVLTALLMAGCQGVPGGNGGGSCWPLPECPEETTTPIDPGPMIPPPGGTEAAVIGEVTLVVDSYDQNRVPVDRVGGAEVTVTHTLLDPRAIPVVEDPFTGEWMPSPHTFIVPQIPFNYSLNILSDTTQVTFKVDAIIEVGHSLICYLAQGGDPVTIPARFTVTNELGVGRGRASVTCTYIRGT